MGKHRIESYLPKAIKVIKEVGILENGKVNSVYNGYIASFGSGIVQGGLLATTAFFENKNASSKEKRDKVTKAILKIIEPTTKENCLFNYLRKKDKINEDLVDKIRDAAVALKLGLRTFKFDKSKEGSD